jgi:hypothetical protein
MFDVYLNHRRELLVVRKGSKILLGAKGKWRKRNKKVVSVSEEIGLAVQRQGYYLRKLTEKKASQVPAKPAFDHYRLSGQ